MTLMDELNALQISDREVEALSGVEPGDRMVGGLLGVYRFSTLRSLTDWLHLVMTEAAIAALLVMVSVFLAVGTVPHLFPGEQSDRPMLQVISGTTILGLGLWNLLLLRNTRSLKVFLNLLDERDRYHQVLQSVSAVQQLADARQQDPQPILDPLHLTRDCLVTGFKTERILREQRSPLSTDRLFALETSLATLQTLAIQDQAHDYTDALIQSLAIGQQVQQALQQKQ